MACGQSLWPSFSGATESEEAMTRLPFLLEDLEQEIRQIAGDGAKISIVLDPGSFKNIAGALESHFGRKMLGDGPLMVGGVRIADGAET